MSASAPQLFSADLAAVNFLSLNLVRQAARKDLAAAACRYGLGVECLRKLTEMTEPQLLNVINNLHEQPVFKLREEVFELLGVVPLPMLAMMAAARQPTAA